jgi:hypothetical protein
MSHRYEPPTDPAARAFHPTQGTGDPYHDSPTMIQSAMAEELPGETRAVGLHRLSGMTWRVTELSAVTAVGFTALFAGTAPAQTVGHATQTPSVKQYTSCPNPWASRTEPHSNKRRHNGRGANAPGVQPSAQPGQGSIGSSSSSGSSGGSGSSAGSGGSSGSSGSSGGGGGGVCAPSPTLAPPSSAPAPAPSTPAPAPSPTTSSGSKGGG